MSRTNRPDHSSDMRDRGDQRQLRSRRRRRRAARGVIKGAFWTLVLAGVFVLGLGYGRTISGDDASTRDQVTVKQSRGTVEATLPTKTVTVTKTVVAKPKARVAAKATPAKP
ncbi:MAG: hypothetical protein JWM90_1800 [Thermoleophilia bacterium]|nr:hypothetical protein [Thermoleophilia bacterium]